MFSFVDQITEIGEGSVRGRFAVPEQFNGAPDWLMFEAIGQLAAWVAISGSDFSKRPVGATVGAIDFVGSRRPRGVLDLSATVERTDGRAVLYRGTVVSEGVEVAAMRRCIGPLLPMDSFDDPENVRARFVALTGPVPIELWSAAHRVPEARVSDLEAGPEGSGVAHFRVEEAATFFEDHFPRLAVVPATILIGAMCGVGAATVDREMNRPPVSFNCVKQVKVRKFTEPGKTLRIEARVANLESSAPEARVVATSDGESIASVRVVCASG